MSGGEATGVEQQVLSQLRFLLLARSLSTSWLSGSFIIIISSFDTTFRVNDDCPH